MAKLSKTARRARKIKDIEQDATLRGRTFTYAPPPKRRRTSRRVRLALWAVVIATAVVSLNYWAVCALIVANGGEPSWCALAFGALLGSLILRPIAKRLR